MFGRLGHVGSGYVDTGGEIAMTITTTVIVLMKLIEILTMVINDNDTISI